MTKKNHNFKICNYQKGMTYIELIIVLSIFSTITSVILFNYSTFQDKVDMKVLANDIALKIVEAQKSSVAGKLPLETMTPSEDWKPSYGVFFDSTDNKNFIYFADLDNNYLFEDTDCSGECLESTLITKNNYISELSIVGSECPSTTTNLNIVFKRPDSNAIISSDSILTCDITYAQITLSSQNSVTASIKIYPSGRIQID